MVDESSSVDASKSFFLQELANPHHNHEIETFVHDVQTAREQSLKAVRRVAKVWSVTAMDILLKQDMLQCQSLKLN